ncbi:alpha/beta hydrolase [uncultured Amnibacterium sp.]|uniref:alpha/beta hydrolase n=1 Tax=uncultured Amnibacterium sp. TaxID=1631851 RepID=UPI0035CB34EA
MSGTTPIHPPFDDELTPILDAYHSVSAPITNELLPAIRAAAAKGLPGSAQFDLTSGGAVVVEEIELPDRDGVTLLILRPATGEGPWPVIYHTHGGGMIMGSKTDGLHVLVPLVVEIGCVVVSVEYRLAPEFPDPVPVEDCYSGLAWTGREIAGWGGDPDRILIFGGSAGGGLAAGSALMARDNGFPQLTHQVLSCPMLDDRFETVSSMMLDGEGVWDRNDNLFGWTSLLGERRGGPDVSYYAAPARATDLSGLPRTYIDVASVETFRDEAIDYARRLSEHGVNVDFHMWGGAFHGSSGIAPHSTSSRAAMSTLDQFLRRALAG